MNPELLVVVGLLLLLSVGPAYDRFLLPRPRLNEDHWIIGLGAVWVLGGMLLILGLTSL